MYLDILLRISIWLYISTTVMFTQAVAARENEMKTNDARDLYRPAAERAALLYFTIKELHNINPMYQYSLKVTCYTGKSEYV